MKKDQSLPLVEVLEDRDASGSFSETFAILTTEEPPEDWSFRLFRACRTFDEVKELAREMGLVAENHFGCICLTRGACEISRFWLFD